MTGNSITQSQGERSGTDRYPADAEADKEDSKRFCKKLFEWNVGFFHWETGSDWPEPGWETSRREYLHQVDSFQSTLLLSLGARSSG